MFIPMFFHSRTKNRPSHEGLKTSHTYNKIFIFAKNPFTLPPRYSMAIAFLLE